MVTQYRFNGDLRDIVVEGESDAALLRHLLRGQSFAREVTVYPASSIYVPREVVERHGQAVGEHGRAVAWMAEVQRLLGHPPKRATAFVDAEWDFANGRQMSLDGIVYLDVHSPEMYAFSEQSIGKLLDVYLGGFRFPADEVMRQIGPCLFQRGLIRAANDALGWNLPWIERLTFIDVDKSGKCSFDRPGFIKAYLLQGGKTVEETSILENQIERIQVASGGDIRRVARGHDFADVLYHYIKRFKTTTTPQEIEKAIVACVDTSELLNAAPVRRLIERLR